MADTRSREQRSRIMASVRQRNTGPEWAIRRLLHSAGFRYRLHDKKLPGNPDIVFPARKKVIFVHGCFWHSHGCTKGRPPKSRPEYWGPKLRTNKDRDEQSIQALEELGWKAFVVWQCELRAPGAVFASVRAFLENGPKKRSTKTELPATPVA